jgi:hypothetical protein
VDHTAEEIYQAITEMTQGDAEEIERKIHSTSFQRIQAAGICFSRTTQDLERPVECSQQPNTFLTTPSEPAEYPVPAPAYEGLLVKVEGSATTHVEASQR